MNVEVIDDVSFEMLRHKTGAEKLRIAFGMFSWARRILVNHLRTEHPDWTEDQVNREAGGGCCMKHSELLRKLVGVLEYLRIQNFVTTMN